MCTHKIWGDNLLHWSLCFHVCLHVSLLACFYAPKCCWHIQLAMLSAAGLCKMQELYILIILYPHTCKSCRETRVELLTVHRGEGVCFAVNIHWIAKERQIINWSRRFAFLSRMKMWRKKGASTRWRDLVCPSTPASTTDLMATSSPKVACLFFNSPVREPRSGRCAAWPKDCFRNTTCV